VKEFLVGRARRVLILRGPAGCGKAAVLRALCNDLCLQVVEWKPASRAAKYNKDGTAQQSMTDSFLQFLAQTDRYVSLSQSPGYCERGHQHVTLVRDFPYTLVDHRYDSAKKFLDCFHAMIEGGSVQRAVFCFNDGRDDHVTITKLFGRMDASTAFTINFEGIPRTFAQRALENVARKEGIQGNAVDLAMLAAECGGDLRHAINALQLAGCSQQGPVRASQSGQHGARNNCLNRGKLPAASASEKGADKGKVIDDSGLRSASLGLFHALGRILYCKRIPPDNLAANDALSGNGTKRRRRNELEPRQLPPELLIPKCKRPPLYFVPEEVLSGSNQEPSVLVDWLFTNSPRFFGDVNDLAEFSRALAEVDTWGSKARTFANGGEFIAPPWDTLAADVKVRALLDANLHPVPPSFGDMCNVSSNQTDTPLFNMVRPLMRDIDQHKQLRTHDLNSILEALGPRALRAASATATLVTRTLPYVHWMLSFSRGTHASLRLLPHSFMQLVMDLSAPAANSLPQLSSSSLIGVGTQRGLPQASAALPAQSWACALDDDPIEVC